VVALGAAAVAALPALQTERAAQHARRNYLSRVRDAHLLKIRWGKLAGGTSVRRNPELSYRVAKRLREDRKSFFRGPRGALPGTKLLEHVRLIERSRCSGEVATAKRLSASRRHALFVSGSAIDRALEKPVEAIAIVDRRGVVRGLGAHFTKLTTNPERYRTGDGFRWEGLVRGSICDGEHVAYGLVEDGTAACWIGDLGEDLDPLCAFSDQKLQRMDD
jgi:hypothetical protein